MPQIQVPAGSFKVIEGGKGSLRVRRLDGRTELLDPGVTYGRYHIDAGRTGLFVDPPEPRRARQAEGEADAPPAAGPKLEVATGLPILLRRIRSRGRSARPSGGPDEVLYEIERLWPDGRREPPTLYSHAEICKGEHLAEHGAAITGRRAIDDEARIILAQLAPAFGVPDEAPERHSGLASEGDAYVTHDGKGERSERGRLITTPGQIVGGSLLHPKRRARWERRWRPEDRPDGSPPELGELDAAVRALITFDPKGRALCAALTGARALFYSLRPMRTSMLLSGASGSGKTTIAQIMHWAEGPCGPTDEPDLAFRTTATGAELTMDRARDCAFLIDDGEAEHAAAGAVLTGATIKFISDNARQAFDGAPAKVRAAAKGAALAEQRTTRQLLVFTVETAAGLIPSVLSRTTWWEFGKGEICRAPMLDPGGDETPTWIATQTAITKAAHGALARCFALPDRQARADWLAEIDEAAEELAAQAVRDWDGPVEQSSRVQHGLAMIIAGAMLCDVGALTENHLRDLAAHFGGALAREQLARLAAGGGAETAAFDRAWFAEAFGSILRGGEHVWRSAETGGFLRGDETADLEGLGYQWRTATDAFPGRWEPLSRPRLGWRDADRWLVDPAALLDAFARRVKREGGRFPFDRNTLAAHLAKIGFAERSGEGRATHRLRTPGDWRSSTRVVVIPFGFDDGPTDAEAPETGGNAGGSDQVGTAFPALTQTDTSNVPTFPPTHARTCSDTQSDLPAQREEPRQGPKSGATGQTSVSGATLPPDPEKAASGHPRAIPRPIARLPEKIAALDAAGLVVAGASQREALKPQLVLDELAGLIAERRITQLWLHPSYDGAADPERRPWHRLTNAHGEAYLITTASDERWPFREAADAAELLKAVAAFKTATGWAPQISPPVVFDKMLRGFHARGTDLSASVEEWPDPMWKETVQDVWLRPLRPDERRGGQYVLGADKSAAYLSVMRSLAVGFGKPLYRAACPFVGRDPGYWRVTLTWPEGAKPWPPFADGWHVTPTLILAAELGARIDVAEAWVFPERHQPFSPVHKRISEARSALQGQDGHAAALALAAVKSLYTQGLGNLASKVKRGKHDAGQAQDLLRPDWRQFIRAASQANIIRNARAAGIRPFGLRTDAIYWVSETPAIPAELKLGITPGAWKQEGGALPIAALPPAFDKPAKQAVTLLGSVLKPLLLKA